MKKCIIAIILALLLLAGAALADPTPQLSGGAGMDTASVLYGYGSRKELEEGAPTYLCETPAHLLEAIKNS